MRCLRIWHDKHGDSGVADKVFRGAAHYEMPQAGAAVGADDQHAGF